MALGQSCQIMSPSIGLLSMDGIVFRFCFPGKAEQEIRGRDPASGPRYPPRHVAALRHIV